MTETPEFTSNQRDRIIRDIINHKADTKQVLGNDFTRDKVTELENKLQRLSDSDLRRVWEGNVGVWLCSIGGEYPSFYDAWLAVEDEYDNPAIWQFQKLLNDEETDYEYQRPAYTTRNPRQNAQA